jgi:hypothetical protein
MTVKTWRPPLPLVLTKSVVVTRCHLVFVTRRLPARLAAPPEARPFAELSLLTDQLFFEALSWASHIKL